jgi:hypothetical protein
VGEVAAYSDLLGFDPSEMTTTTISAGSSKKAPEVSAAAAVAALPEVAEVTNGDEINGLRPGDVGYLKALRDAQAGGGAAEAAAQKQAAAAAKAEKAASDKAGLCKLHSVEPFN